MKTIVSDQHLPEGEIKPSRQAAEFRAMLDSEFQQFLATGVPLAAIACPGCGGDEPAPAFVKSGLSYQECRICASVYASPRPASPDVERFYRTSEAVAYWHNVLLPDTRAARLSKIVEPRARWVLGTADRYLPSLTRILDIGQHSGLLIAELLQSRSQHFNITVAGQLADLEGGCPDGLAIAPTPLEKLGELGPVQLVLAFDALDRAPDLGALMRAAHSVLEPQGLLLAGSTLISGFDLQTLWDGSESISPPERLNLLTEKGVLSLCERHGFEVLEFSTPGVFDVEIVQRAILAHPEEPWPRFLRYLTTRCEPEVLEGFQEFLQKYRLSSFARLALRKL